MTFVDLAAAGAALADALLLARPDLRGAPVVGLGERGHPVARAVAAALGSPALMATADVASAELTLRDRDDGGLEGEVAGVVTGRVVIVVPAGVETGQAALLAASALRGWGASGLVLATPVCPRQAEPELRTRYDDIVAVERPLARRSLTWHYADWPPTSPG